jgi:Cu-Zn family superoxide dismutase
MNKKKMFLSALSFFITSVNYAATLTSEVYTTDGTKVGNIVFEDQKYGLLITPKLTGLPSGIHGFHIHQHPDCGDHGMKAGEHLDPATTKSHQGPYRTGHLGDLPILLVNNEGTATLPVLAPRLKTEDIQGHSIMIHQGGDNYSNHPKLGGGGARIACGKIS